MFEKTKITEKEAGVGPFFKKNVVAKMGRPTDLICPQAHSVHKCHRKNKNGDTITIP